MSGSSESKTASVVVVGVQVEAVHLEAPPAPPPPPESESDLYSAYVAMAQFAADLRRRLVELQGLVEDAKAREAEIEGRAPG